MTTHDLQYPNVFFVQSMSTIKIRMFAKTRAQNIEFWPNGGHFWDDRSVGKTFHFFLEI